MDYRVAPQPSELAWLPPRGFGKTQTVAAMYAGKRIAIQTPVVSTRVYRDPRSVTLYLAVDDVFASFIQSYEDHAASLPYVAAVERSPAIRNGNLRVTVWENEAQWFDVDGTFLAQPPAVVRKCACVLEFGGCWISNEKWGLKWRVTQIRLVESDDDCVKKPDTGYAFLD